MAIYKSLGPDDISRVPFNANRLFTFNSASGTSTGITLKILQYSQSILDSISAGSDSKNTLQYYQLDHLFYKDYLRSISNRLGDADYLFQNRKLYKKCNVISIPSTLYGNSIKPGTFSFSGSWGYLIDDSKGNLIISGTNLVSHSIDEREKVFSLEPLKGFKQFDVNYDLYGKVNPNPVTYYNRIKIFDNSYYSNVLDYKNIKFSKQNYGGQNVTGSQIDFHTTGGLNSITSSIVGPHNELYNFETDNDFTISFYMNQGLDKSSYIIGKSTTETILKDPVYLPLNTTGSSQPFDVKSKNQFPFDIFTTIRAGTSTLQINFERSDGVNTKKITSTLASAFPTGSTHHIVCMKSASKMEIWIDGVKNKSETDTTVHQTSNKANLYLGSKGETSKYYSGSLSDIMIFNTSKTQEQIKSLSSSLNGSPYVGNLYYSNGMGIITHPNHQNIASSSNTPYQLEFKNIHPIYENEYMCTINADEYNFTHNTSTRKIKSDQHAQLSNFATGSQFKPYVTTVGLYNEDNELLVIGKLGQPVITSDETDTTFVLRWDT